MKVAIIHDYLREFGGAERVVEVLHEIWPEAPLYTSFVDWNALGANSKRFKNWNIKTSWVQKNYIVKKFHSPLRFLVRQIWESFDLSGFDLVISSSGWFISRGVVVKKPCLHICYIHNPPRNLYGYPTGSTVQKYKIVRIYAHFINFFMRQYDFTTAQKVDYFISNSKETQKRVEKFYRRDSDVIYPPVIISPLKRSEIIPSKNRKKSYYLTVGRLSWAKRVDLIIKAANKLGINLIVAGSGKEMDDLKKIANPNIKFLGNVTDSELINLYKNAKAVIFSALNEDFGLVPVEAMSYGTPVIALQGGGVDETVINLKTGIFFKEADENSLSDAIKNFEEIYDKVNWAEESYKQGLKFTKEIFKTKITKFVEKHFKNNI